MKEENNIDVKPNSSESQNKNKNVKKEKFNKGFFKKLYYSIVKIERYPEMAAEGLPRALSYFTKLIAIFAIISCLGSLYNLNKVLSEAVTYLQNSFPEFSYSEGILDVQNDEPLIFENNEQVGKIIVDTKEDDEQKINDYTNQIIENGSGIVVLKDKVVVKTESVMGTANYTYAELFNQLGLTSFNKQDVINFINSSQVISLYFSVFLMMFIYVFVIYFLNILTYVIFVSLFGVIANLITKLRMRYVAVFNMAVYSITLSTILYMIYLGINIFVPFQIKYFEPMYISVATIYLIAAIFILKSEAIKKQVEVMKIQEFQRQIKEEMERKQEEERQKQEQKRKDKEKEEKERKNKEKEEGTEEKNKQEQDKEKKEKKQERERLGKKDRNGALEQNEGKGEAV